MKPNLFIVAVALPLSGCISFGAKPPPSLLNLTSVASQTATAARRVTAADAIAISIPATPQAIATTRVAVSDGGIAIAYVKKALWVETPARLFQRLLGETVAAKTGRFVLDPRQTALTPSTQLSGQLLRFGIDAPSGDAVVIYDAVLSREGGKQFLSRRFEARAKATAIEANASGKAINGAANQVAGDVADWINDSK